MERFARAAFVLFFAARRVVYASRALQSGEVQAGPNLLERAFTPTREDSPGPLHLFALLYLCAGGALAARGVRMALGLAAPVALS